MKDNDRMYCSDVGVCAKYRLTLRILYTGGPFVVTGHAVRHTNSFKISQNS